MIDVEKLQEKLDKSEKVRNNKCNFLLSYFSILLLLQVRAATDSKLIELQKKFSSLKETNERGEKSREKLSGELKDVKKKVTLNALQAPFSKGTTSVCGYLKIMILKFDILSFVALDDLITNGTICKLHDGHSCGNFVSNFSFRHHTQ